MSRRVLKFVPLLLLSMACARTVVDTPLSPIPPRPTTPGPSPAPILQMPDVVGMAYVDAKAALRTRGFKVDRADKYSTSDPAEHVIRQSEKVGRIVPAGTVITLTVAIPIPGPVNGNPWGYNWGCCEKIYTPPADFCTYFACVETFYNGTGFVVQCEDGQFSLTGGNGKTTCSSHHGLKRPLYDPD